MAVHLGGVIDRTSPIPIYHQIEKIILDSIERGELSEGDMLPNERLLQQIYGVSRSTIRQARPRAEVPCSYPRCKHPCWR